MIAITTKKALLVFVFVVFCPIIIIVALSAMMIDHGWLVTSFWALASWGALNTAQAQWVGGHDATRLGSTKNKRKLRVGWSWRDTIYLDLTKNKEVVTYA